ncbi:hypothetical protein OSTOST_08852 [Ostertagia ostertagi]
MESCIKPFLEGCDTDKDGTISIHEWGKCLGLKDEGFDPASRAAFRLVLSSTAIRPDPYL